MMGTGLPSGVSQYAHTASESGLALTLTDLQTAVADFLSMTSRAVPTDATDLARVNDAIDAGLRQFYFPALLREREVHEWSFLRPTATLDTISSVGDYSLPSDLGGIEGNLTYAVDQNYAPVVIRGEGFIRQQRQANVGSGKPQFAAIQPVVTNGATGQRYRLLLWPSPDGAYQLTFRYNVLPDSLTSSNPYPLGGTAHAETLLQSCRAAADRMFNDTIGSEQQLFLDRLAASVSMDRRYLAPAHFGLNLDRSDLLNLRLSPRDWKASLPGVTVLGTVVQ